MPKISSQDGFEAQEQFTLRVMVTSRLFRVPFAVLFSFQM